MVYCTRTDIEAEFGPDNVIKWADADNKRVDANIAIRIEWAIEKATDHINARMYNSMYVFPLTVETPGIIRRLCATFAGVYLYQSPRGIVDDDNTGMSQIEENANEILERLARNATKLVGVPTGYSQNAEAFKLEELDPRP